MDSKFVLDTEKLKRENRLKKTIRIVLLILFLILILLYFVFGIIYNSGNFSITLDRNLYFEKGLIIYDDPGYKVYRTELYAEGPNSFDNISYKWLPNDIDEYDGTHNGDNYLAYTFYIENIGDTSSDYWSEMIIDDVIKNVDEAIRIRIYKNGEAITYAKKSKNGIPEKNTVMFQNDDLIVREHVEKLLPGEKVKYTIVLWLEGSDPECTDNVLGGEFKVHMEFNSEFNED